MPTNKTHLKKAAYTLFNDVIEQSFRQLINFPEEGDRLNKIIQKASDELNFMTAKIDRSDEDYPAMQLKSRYDQISSELNEKSMVLMKELHALSVESSRIS